MTETIKKQILEIRDSGETNMFDTAAVRHLAARNGFRELFAYLADHRKEYVNFILTGEEK